MLALPLHPRRQGQAEGQQAETIASSWYVVIEVLLSSPCLGLLTIAFISSSFRQ